jgi:hypothetical protein
MAEALATRVSLAEKVTRYSQFATDFAAVATPSPTMRSAAGCVRHGSDRVDAVNPVTDREGLESGTASRTLSAAVLGWQSREINLRPR